jgi:cytochrome c-type biogenesis protein CcmH/NrfG
LIFYQRGKTRDVFPVYIVEATMKNIIIFVLIGVGIILSGCKGTPTAVDSFGNTQPNLQVTTVGVEIPGITVPEYDSNAFGPRYNQDGSITMLTFNNVRVSIMPMTDTRTRGALNRTTDEFDAMIATYSGTVQSNPQDYDSCIMLAGLYIDRGLQGDPSKGILSDAELAVQYSNQALAISKDNPEALYTRGLAYSEQGDNVNALKDLETVLRSNIQSMKGVYYVMGMIHFKEGKTEEAISAFEKVKTIDPDFVDIDEILEHLYNL